MIMQLSALGSKNHNTLLFCELLVWLDSFTPWFDRICFFQLTDFKAVSHHMTVSLVYVPSPFEVWSGWETLQNLANSFGCIITSIIRMWSSLILNSYSPLIKRPRFPTLRVLYLSMHTKNYSDNIISWIPCKHTKAWSGKEHWDYYVVNQRVSRRVTIFPHASDILSCVKLSQWTLSKIKSFKTRVKREC